MSELDRPTESEVKAGGVLRTFIEQLTGDSGRADYHVQVCRRHAERRGITKFMDYLFVLAGEIPQLVVDPAYRASAYRLQQTIDLAKLTVEQEDPR